MFYNLIKEEGKIFKLKSQTLNLVKDY